MMDDLKLAFSGVAKQVVRNWINWKLPEHWQLAYLDRGRERETEIERTKEPLQKPSAKQIRKLLEINRTHLTQVTKIMSPEKMSIDTVLVHSSTWKRCHKNQVKHFTCCTWLWHSSSINVSSPIITTTHGSWRSNAYFRYRTVNYLNLRTRIQATLTLVISVVPGWWLHSKPL